ncbi:MAG: formylmethanofuran--tetrahydromethanopterin N-formyltransferase [Planctomycetaceae bacterium]|nr:formylmethanofuran--tetrahydromethanopterin N-formyltransferase [Planctomycetaceae bacterium]
MSLKLHGVPIVDTFAEAFGITGTRLIITADSPRWAETAAQVLCGYATSVIACDMEAGVERTVPASESPDGRPGVAVLAFAFSRDALAQALQSRVGQCVLTAPTTACFNGIADAARDKMISVGGGIRFFGDGYQFAKKIDAQRFWRIPVMDGEFLCEEKFGTVKGVAGGNLLICGTSTATALQAAETAVDAMRTVPNVIMPFPGGIVRSGSKVGSQYKKLKASTNDAYCPTLRGIVESALPVGCGAVYEIVIDGLDAESVQAAMRAGLHAAVTQPDVLQITAGNYGGKLGKHHFHLKDLLS